MPGQGFVSQKSRFNKKARSLLFDLERAFLLIEHFSYARMSRIALKKASTS